MYTSRNWLSGAILALVMIIAPAVCRGNNIPDIITLDSLAQFYDKVDFNHALHINVLKDCAGCHHHTTGNLVESKNCVRCHKNSSETAVVACRGCHAAQPFSAVALNEKHQEKHLYHQDKPGLKGAYHQSCMGCHTKMGAPTGCKDCHARNKNGEALFNAGSFAPQKASGKTAHKGH